MGHLASIEKEYLLPLVKRLNYHPIGIPESEELFEILSILYTREEAEIASKFPLLEATLEELSLRLEKTPKELLPILERMSEKGILTESSYRGKNFFLLSPLLIGLFEFTFMKTNQELPLKRLAELLEVYEKGPLGGELISLKTKIARVLPYEKAVPSLSTSVLSYEKAKEIMDSIESIGIATCYCRHKSKHLGKNCPHPLEDICMSFGKAAEFLVRRGFARGISRDQAFEVLYNAEERGLIHVLDNVRSNPTFLCHCCSCCCVFFSAMKTFAGSYTLSPSNFLAIVNCQKCKGCGKCAGNCPVKAISADNSGTVIVDMLRCLGCGLCSAVCPAQAIILTRRKKKIVPPGSVEEKYIRLAIEKGKAVKYLPEALKRLFRKFPF